MNDIDTPIHIPAPSEPAPKWKRDENGKMEKWGGEEAKHEIGRCKGWGKGRKENKGACHH